MFVRPCCGAVDVTHCRTARSGLAPRWAMGGPTDTCHRAPAAMSPRMHHPHGTRQNILCFLTSAAA